jgi:hypothetical protein
MFMADEFEDINNRIPDLSTALAQRITSKKAEESGITSPPPGTVDPYQLMLKRKQGETAEVNPETIVKWPEDSVKKLEDYCKKMGIAGFNSGRMHPLAALAMLKKQFGDDYTDVPLEERVPVGYEKMGTSSGYGPNYPYFEAMQKKQILHG